MSIQSMTFHESYGPLPKRLLDLFKRVNVSPADYDVILDTYDCVWDDPDIPWDRIYRFTEAMSEDGHFSLDYPDVE